MARKSFSGAEVKSFWEAWPPGGDWYVDDGSDDVMELIDRGELKAADVVADWALGYLGWQGDGDEPETGPYRSGLEVSVVLERWLRDQSEVLIAVRIPKDQSRSFRECIKSHGGDGWKIA